MHAREVIAKVRSNAILVLLMLGLIAGTWTAGHVWADHSRVPTPSRAAEIVSEMLKPHPAGTVTFQVGRLGAEGQNPCDIRCRLLEKAGVVFLTPIADSTTNVSLTEKGTNLLKQIPGVGRSAQDGIVTYVVPLAKTQLVDISNITAAEQGRANVHFTWRWIPNPLGEAFDTSGPLVRGLSPEDRAILVNEYGLWNYHQAPQRAIVAVMKTATGWQLATD